jgi:hypothetical protein
MKQWTGPTEQGSAVGLRFYPRDMDGMNERLEYIAKAVRSLSNADGFTFTAGDPGGVPKELGPSGVQDWISMAKEVKQVVNCEASNALFDINPWAVTQWEDEGMDVFDYVFWQKEVSNAKEIVSADNLINDECGIEFCPHNYYRSLALTLYDKAGITPELYPTRKEVEILKQHMVPRLWAWPYFLIDEVDDGYLGPDGFSSGQTQGETRYIHKRNRIEWINCKRQSRILQSRSAQHICIRPTLPESITYTKRCHISICISNCKGREHP